MYKIVKRTPKENSFLEKIVLKYLKEKEEYVNYMKEIDV